MNRLLIFLLFPLAVFSQAISGVAIDQKTRRPLAFATVIAGDSIKIANADGKFWFASLSSPQIEVRYRGYQTVSKTVVPNKRHYFFTLTAEPGFSDQAALSLALQASKMREQNDPQRKLKSFSLNAYNKLIVTANPDSVNGSIDTVFASRLSPKGFVIVDSSMYKFKKFIATQHLFQTEKYSHYQFDGENLKETVLATKMSGFSKPVYEVLGFNLQSFSVYGDTYELFETKYRSPLDQNASKDYNFRILDTVKLASREVVMLYFRNKRRSRKAGLEGLLYLDSQTKAVAKAIFRVKNVIDITANHEFEFREDLQLYFPTGRDFKIVKGNNEEDIRILGGTIRFDAVSTDNPSRRKEPSDFTYVTSQTTYSNITYNDAVVIRKPSIAIEVRDDAITKNDDFWTSLRGEPAIREINTYRAIDSIAARQKVEKRIRLGRKAINGFIPFGPIDIDLRHLLSYNNYEGFRLGFGGITNELFSEKYRVEGYSAYGTKDGNFKYNIGGAARIGRFSNTWIGATYTDDVREIASTTFAIDKRAFKLYDPRPINISTFYGHVTWRGYIETRIIPKTESIWTLSQSHIEPKFNYVFTADGKTFTSFLMTMASASLQWNPFSDFMQTPSGRIENEKRFPKFTFQFTKSLPGVLGNDFDFAKADIRAEYEKKYLNGQKSSVVIEAGYAFGDLPLTHLYNTSPNNLNNDRLLQRVTIAGKNAFETMYFNEFFSSEFVMLQLKHGSKRITLLKNVRPSMVLVTRMAWGNMKNPEQHSGIQYKTLDKGYFESGIELNQIYKVFGISGFYRYGPNQLSRFEDNLSIKVSFILNLGF